MFVLPLFILGSLLASFVVSPILRLLILLCFTVFIIAQLISIYFSGGVIDYQFFVNLNVRDIWAGLRIFKLQAALAVLAFITGVALLFWLTQSINRILPAYLRLTGMGLCAVWLGHPEGPMAKLAEIYQITTVRNTSFERALQHFPMTSYVPKSALSAQKGKNIIVISLESFERGFLDIPGIAPKLKQLTSRYTYYPNMPMGMGSSWTTASMYTYMTGVPFLVGDFSATPMENLQQTKLVSLGDILGQAGYQMRYVMTNPEFADMGKIIRTFGIQVVSEHDYPDAYPKAPFGLYDRDIFDIAKKEVLKLRTQPAPFALFVSTISTHAPNGFKDERMERWLGKIHREDMDFAAAALDYSVGDFIQFLESQGVLENTVFYIFPDHLMMGAGTKTIAKLSEQARSLYLISNAKSATLNIHPSHVIHQIDLPRLILRGAQVHTNAMFLTDYIANKDNTLRFIQKNKHAIAQLNKAAAVSKPASN